MSKYVNQECINAFVTIREAINSRYLNTYENKHNENNIDDEEIETKIKSIKERENLQFKSKETTKSIKDDSPFTNYFKKKMVEFEKEVSKNNEKDKENFFYNPALFEIIVKILHIMPLWSGVMIKDELSEMNSKYFSRESNNIVENWFGHLRNNILKISKREKMKRRLMPSQLISNEFKYIKKKFQDLYEKKEILIDSKSTQNTKKNKRKLQTPISEMNEKWEDGIPSKKQIRNKGIFYKNPNNACKYKNDDKIESEIKSSIDPKFDSLFNSGII